MCPCVLPYVTRAERAEDAAAGRYTQLSVRDLRGGDGKNYDVL